MAPVFTTFSLFGQPLTLYGYGAMLSLAVLVGALSLLLGAARRGVDEGAVLACTGAALMAGFAGAHGLYLLVAALQGQAVAPLFGRGGIVFLGGALFGGLGFAGMARLFGLPLLPTLDLAAAPLAMAHAVGRLGCLLGGCCFGRPFSGPWAVAYSHPLAPMPDGVLRHPVQAYEALGLVLLAVVLLRISPARRPGTGFSVYLIGYALLRAALESYRGDTVRGLFLGGLVSTSQALSLLLLGAGLALLFRLRASRCTPRVS